MNFDKIINNVIGKKTKNSVTKTKFISKRLFKPIKPLGILNTKSSFGASLKMQAKWKNM